MKKTVRVTFILISLCTCAMFADAATNAAIAFPVGEASLNGTVLTRSSPVFDGDQLRTGRTSSLVLNLPGASVQVGPNSVVRYRGGVLELSSGTTRIAGAEGVLSGGITVSAAGPARYAVERSGIETAVSLISGELKLERGKEVVTISAPGTYSFRDDEPLSPVKKHGKALKVGIGAAAAGTAAIISRWLTGEDGSSTSGTCISNKSPSSCR